jgi:hypothetical protein
MLNAYLAATSNLLQNPAAPTSLYSTANLTTYINSARGQLAAESESIRAFGTFTLVPATQSYNFPAITLAASGGVQGVLNVRAAWLVNGTGQIYLQPEAFETFSLYELNAATVLSGIPTKWSQYAQGVNGSVFFSPVPAVAGTVVMDCVCYPIPLVSDATVEAIPYLWTDAVPYFAAYLALLSAQTGVRTQEADAMLKRYTEFVNRARRGATPSTLPWLFEQTQVPGGITPQPQQQRPG